MTERLRPRRALHAVVREPLLHFLAIALVLVGLERCYARQHDRYRITMTPQRAQQLVESYRLQHGSAPDAAAREALVLKDLDDEVLHREALALGLDRDDEIIRRRLIQKMRFLSEDLNPPAEPTTAQLQAYFATHRARYRQPARASFGHVFFSEDRHGEAGAVAKARAVMQRLTAKDTARASTLGDPFTDNYDFAGYEAEQVQRVFGRSPFSAAVFEAPAGRWSGPYRSAYGWHLLRVDARQPAADATFDEVRERVRADYLAEAQAAANAAAFARLKAQYTLLREDREATP